MERGFSLQLELRDLLAMLFILSFRSCLFLEAAAEGVAVEIRKGTLMAPIGGVFLLAIVTSDDVLEVTTTVNLITRLMLTVAIVQQEERNLILG